MATNRTILHPTDFSACSQHALDLAATVARERGARLLVLHVGPAPVVSLGAVPPTPEEYDRAGLDAKLQAVSAPAGVKMERQLVFGDTVTEINRVAQETGAEMIVLGTHGRTGLRRLLMGSVAEHVLRHAPCPVLTIRHP
jgi:nucleotide-binding universal stress UspA family protein